MTGKEEEKEEEEKSGATHPNRNGRLRARETGDCYSIRRRH